MMTRDEAVAFGKASAETALDQVSAWGSLQNSIDNYRENVRDTLNEHRASEHESEAFAAFDAVIAASRPSTPAGGYTPIFRVYVLKPLKGRERKHTLACFRVGAADEAEAVAKVQRERLDDSPWPGERVVACTRFGDAGAVVYDGCFFLTPAEVAARYPGK